MDNNQNDNRNQQTDSTSKGTNNPGDKSQNPNNPTSTNPANKTPDPNKPENKNQDPNSPNRITPGSHMPNTPERDHQVGESDKRENKNREITANDPTGNFEDTDAPLESDGPYDSNLDRTNQTRTENTTGTAANRGQNTPTDENRTDKQDPNKGRL